MRQDLIVNVQCSVFFTHPKNKVAILLMNPELHQSSLKTFISKINVPLERFLCPVNLELQLFVFSFGSYVDLDYVTPSN